MTIQQELNHNNVLFNIKFPFQIQTNLIDYSKRKDLYKKSKDNRIHSNILRSEFKQKGNNTDLISSFVKYEIPNWNIKFIINSK